MARGSDYGLSEAIVWDMSSRSEYEQTKDVLLVLLKVYQMVAFADGERKNTSPLMQQFKAHGVIHPLFDELSLVQPRNFMLADYSYVDDEDTIELLGVVDKILRFVRVALEKTEFGPLYEARLQAAFHITKAFFKIFVEGESVNIIPFSNTLLQPDACEQLISLISSEATKYPQRTHWYKRWQAAVNATVSAGDRGSTARPNSSAAMSSAGSGRSCSLARGHGQTSHPQSPAPSPAVSSLASASSVRGKRPFESVSNAVPSPPEDIRMGNISQGSETTIQSTTESATMLTEEGLEAAATRARRAVKKLDAEEKHGDDMQPSPQSHDLLVFDDDQKQQPPCHELPPSPPKKRKRSNESTLEKAVTAAEEDMIRRPGKPHPQSKRVTGVRAVRQGQASVHITVRARALPVPQRAAPIAPAAPASPPLRDRTSSSSSRSPSPQLGPSPVVGPAAPAQGARKRKANVPRKDMVVKRRRQHALQEIRRYQKSGSLLIPRLPFMRLVREVMHSYTTEARITGVALEALQEAAETYLTGMFATSDVFAIHARRVTVQKSDLSLWAKMLRPLHPLLLPSTQNN